MMAPTNKGSLGSAIRILRTRNGWTLRQMSKKVGIPFSTLAKVERNRLTLTYEKLRQVSRGLNMTMSDLLDQAEAPTQGALVVGRRSLGSAGNSVTVSSPTSSHEYLCTDIRMKRMVPIISRILPSGIGELREPVRCTGEAFLFVLEGTIEVHMHCYLPVTLGQGNWIYFDSAMAQAIVPKNCQSAMVLRCVAARIPRWRVLLSSVILFAPSAPVIQILIPTMRALDRSQLIIEIRQGFAAQRCRRNRDQSRTQSVFAQPPYIDLAGYHLLQRPDIDVAQRRRRGRLV